MAAALDALRRRQQAALGLRPAARVATTAAAERFLTQQGIVLRHATASGVPLASLRGAAGPANDPGALELSIRLVNHLLASSRGIEVTVVGTRLTLVDRELMPPLYRLVRRGRSPGDLTGLSLAARTAATLIAERREVTTGDVRARLGLRATPRSDPAYAALAELQRHLLVDRGPFVVPERGIPYLSREGYPYRFFHDAHADLARLARGLDDEAAADLWIGRYLRSAVFAPPRTLASLFRVFLSGQEITASIARLVQQGTVIASRVDGCAVVVHAGRTGPRGYNRPGARAKHLRHDS